MASSTPRVFVVRHGETEWSLSGKHTSHPDLPLTRHGERRAHATGAALVGDDRLIVPGKLAHIYVSPRRRAPRTLELLSLRLPDRYPWQRQRQGTAAEQKEAEQKEAEQKEAKSKPGILCSAHVEVTEDVREWDYGEYEGITSPEIRKIRADAGIDRRWDIWRDGCPGGESPDDIVERLDRIIADIRSRWHAPALQTGRGGDVFLVAHGHILRALALRWCGKELHEGPAFLMEAGGVGILGYEHHSIEEPALLLGGAFTVSGE